VGFFVGVLWWNSKTRKVGSTTSESETEYRGRFTDERSERSVSEVIPPLTPNKKATFMVVFLFGNNSFGDSNPRGLTFKKVSFSKFYELLAILSYLLLK